jgi:hypothetical protein
LARWHRIVFERDLQGLKDILAEEITFFSPVRWKPFEGRPAAHAILSTVMEVFQDFAYHRQFVDGQNWALEFSARVDDLSLKGIDLIQFNDQGQIQTFEVFIRPVNALQAVATAMGQRLAERGAL